jgi:hypothetical protein
LNKATKKLVRKGRLKKADIAMGTHESILTPESRESLRRKVKKRAADSSESHISGGGEKVLSKEVT